MKIFKSIGLLLLMVGAITSCDDSDNIRPTKIYPLKSVSNPNISGTATFIENDDFSTTVELQLTGVTGNPRYPAHIHANSASETGPIVVDLARVDGARGFSSTTFSRLKDGTEVTYQDMIEYDGYINVHLSSSDLATLVAQGNIGSNAN